MLNQNRRFLRFDCQLPMHSIGLRLLAAKLWSRFVIRAFAYKAVQYFLRLYVAETYDIWQSNRNY